MFENAAIIGVGQSAYTRRPEPGQTALHFMRDAVVAALKDAGLNATDIQGMAVASFSLAPDAAVDLAWKLGLSLRWLAQDTNGGSSGMSMLGNALRDGRDRRRRRGPHPRRRRHRARRLRQGRGELQHRDAEAPVAARPRRPERRLCAGGEPPDQEIRPGEIRLRPHRHRAASNGRRRIPTRSIARR